MFSMILIIVFNVFNVSRRFIKVCEVLSIFQAFPNCYRPFQSSLRFSGFQQLIKMFLSCFKVFARDWNCQGVLYAFQCQFLSKYAKCCSKMFETLSRVPMLFYAVPTCCCCSEAHPSIQYMFQTLKDFEERKKERKAER